MLSILDDAPTRAAVTVERQFLLELGGGCAVPVAAFGSVIRNQPPVISLIGLVISPDGKQSIRVTGRGADALELGGELARKAIQHGAGSILQLIAEH
jgi:hydroxymethylbilane synthase